MPPRRGLQARGNPRRCANQRVCPASEKAWRTNASPVSASGGVSSQANSADCRERAQRCAKLAAAAATPELAAVLSDIAQKWAVLAAELDRTDRALASWQAPEAQQR